MSPELPDTNPLDETSPLPSGAEQTRAIFERALELPTEARGRFLQEQCTDPAVRAEVADLLEAYHKAASFMATAEPPGGAPGSEIGRYKLLQKIGEGGFGVVWMAEQTEPIRRKVAVKVIKVGMDTHQVIARFEAERQALAMMEHPHIARVLDGGATEAGRPYFVMELVRGVPITEFCDTEQWTPRARIELFQKVCHAVQHAHHKGIIHRDLKPGNILVTMHDRVATPKVIDFGVAKATGQELTQRTLFTEYHQMIGTPEYMAPEQAQYSGLDVDTRADVYSLGIVLYELLTGTKAFDPNRLRSGDYADMVRHIRESEPAKPSTRVSSLGDQLDDIAHRRRIEARDLRHTLRGDLDWIVMKAIEKDRNRRYDTAAALAEDLQRHLDNVPVIAGPPGTAYRLGKFVRRNRAMAAAGLLLLLSLVGGVVGTGVMLRRALAAERTARAEADRASTVLEVTRRMLASANPYHADPDYTLRELLDDFELEDSEEIADQPDVEAALRLTLGEAYLAIGALDRAEQHLQRALEIEEQHGDPARLVPALLQWGTLRFHRAGYDDVLVVCDRALAMTARGAPDPTMELELQDLRAQTLCELRRIDEAKALCLAAIDTARAAGLDQAHAGLLGTLGRAHRLSGEYEDAERVFREALALRRRTLRAAHPEVVVNLANIATTESNRGRYAAAEKHMREAIELLRSQHGDGHHHIAILQHNLAGFVSAQGRPDEAEDLIRTSIATTTERLGASHPNVGKAWGALGKILIRKGQVDQSVEAQEKAVDILTEALGADHPDVGTTLNNLAIAVDRQGRYQDAVRLYQRSIDVRKRSIGPICAEVGQSTLNLAFCHIGNDNPLAAEPVLIEAIDVLRALHGERHRAVQENIVRLGALLRRTERPAEAATTITEALAILDAEAPSSLLRLTGYRELAWARSAQGDWTGAEQAMRRMQELSVELGQPWRGANRLAQLYEQWHSAEPSDERSEQAAHWRAEHERLEAERRR